MFMQGKGPETTLTSSTKLRKRFSMIVWKASTAALLNAILVLFQDSDRTPFASRQRGFYFMKVLLAETAAKLSRNEALLLQQLHYLAVNTNHWQIKRDGRTWIKMDMQEWSEQFDGALSQGQVKRWLRHLREAGLVETIQPDAYKGDQTNAYAINHDQIKNYKQSGKLLIEDLRPIPFNSRLAAEVGINAAAFIGQLDYWLHNEEKQAAKGLRANVYDDAYWQFSSVRYFMEQMPWIRSDKTMRELIKQLERDSYLVSMAGSRNTRRYTLNYDVLGHYAYVAPVTPERKAYTSFYEHEYSYSNGDQSYIAEILHGLFHYDNPFIVEGLDWRLVRDYVKVLGKTELIGMMREVHECGGDIEQFIENLHISCEVFEPSIREINRDNVLQPA